MGERPAWCDAGGLAPTSSPAYTAGTKETYPVTPMQLFVPMRAGFLLVLFGVIVFGATDSLYPGIVIVSVGLVGWLLGAAWAFWYTR